MFRQNLGIVISLSTLAFSALANNSPIYLTAESIQQIQQQHTEFSQQDIQRPQSALPTQVNSEHQRWQQKLLLQQLAEVKTPNPEQQAWVAEVANQAGQFHQYLADGGYRLSQPAFFVQAKAQSVLRQWQVNADQQQVMAHVAANSLSNEDLVQRYQGLLAFIQQSSQQEVIALSPQLQNLNLDLTPDNGLAYLALQNRLSSQLTQSLWTTPDQYSQYALTYLRKADWQYAQQHFRLAIEQPQLASATLAAMVKHPQSEVSVDQLTSYLHQPALGASAALLLSQSSVIDVDSLTDLAQRPGTAQRNALLTLKLINSPLSQAALADIQPRITDKVLQQEVAKWLD